MYDHDHGARRCLKRFAIAGYLGTGDMISTDQEELWLQDGGRAIEALMLMAQVRKPLIVVMEVLKNDTTLMAITKLAIVRRASFELALLGLESIGAPRRSVNALRRSVDSEVAKLRRKQRQDRLTSKEHQVTRVNENDARQALRVLFSWALANRERFWRLELAQESRCRAHRDWVGRWDGGQSILGVDKAVVSRVLLDAGFEDPMMVVSRWQEEGWLEIDAKGAARWQTRIGGHGRRRWLLGIQPLAVEGVVTM